MTTEQLAQIERALDANDILIAQEALRIARDEIARLRAELAEHDASFDLRWKSDMRAIKRWQEATGRTDTWPDHTDLSVWLMEQNSELRAAVRQLREILVDGQNNVMTDALWLGWHNRALKVLADTAKWEKP